MYNYAGCKVEMIVDDNCRDFEKALNNFLIKAEDDDLIVHDIKYQLAKDNYFYRYTALVI
jgi:hypothetical protein